MSPPLLILAVVGLAALGSTLALVRRVPVGRAGVRLRLGRFDETVASGLHLRLPGDRIVLVSLDEQVLRVRRQPVAADSRDGAGSGEVMVEAEVAYRVVEPFRAVTEVSDVAVALEALVLTVARAHAGTRDAHEVVASSDAATEEVRRVLTDASAAWGVRVGDVEVRFDRPT